MVTTSRTGTPKTFRPKRPPDRFHISLCARHWTRIFLRSGCSICRTHFIVSTHDIGPSVLPVVSVSFLPGDLPLEGSFLFAPA